jgi:serine/threonine-protein kinase
LPTCPLDGARLEPVASALLGRTFDDLEVLRELGEGSTAVVYEVRHEGALRALKVLTPRSARHPGVRERFERASRAAMRVVHPGVLRVHRLGRVDDLPYLVSDLATRSLRASPLPLAFDAAVALVVALADALAAAHAASVVHRDVKPENVLFAADGTPLLGDFGLARAEGEPSFTQTGQIVGTPRYLAPESLDGRAGPPADVYALGCLAHEVLTGAPPFVGTATQIIEAHATQEPDLGVVDPRVRAMLAAMLAKAPDDRPVAAAVASGFGAA